MTEDATAKLNYLCEAKTDAEGNYYHPREFRCSVVNSVTGHIYKLRGSTAEIVLQPGVNKLDACSRLFTTGDVSVEQLKK